MYLAVNKLHTSALHSQAIVRIQASASNGRWFALLDRAFDHDRKKTLRWPHASEALYKGSDGIDAVSPTLLQMSSSTSEALTHEIASLLRYCQGRPMLSFVQSSLDIHDLAASWQDVKWAHTEDGQRFLLRWADTRVLSFLPDVLHAHNWGRIAKPLLAWFTVDRFGDLQALKMGSVSSHCSEEPVHLGPLRLEDKELASLLDAAQPDVLINMLFEQIPDVLPVGVEQAKVYSCVQKACDFASQHGIDAAGDQLALAAATCLTEGAVLADSKLTGLLCSHQPGQTSLADILTELLPVDEVSAP